MTKLLYKYRSIENFKYLVDILVNNRFYAAQYTELNDPMEGHYYYRTGSLNEDIRQKLANEKGILRLCSLSEDENNQLMWSHYADGCKGLVIGVEIDELKYDVKNVVYGDLPFLERQDYNHMSAQSILTNKMQIWEYEREIRVFTNKGKFIRVNIKKIFFGNRMIIENRKLIRKLIEKINPEIDVLQR